VTNFGWHRRRKPAAKRLTWEIGRVRVGGMEIEKEGAFFVAFAEPGQCLLVEAVGELVNFRALEASRQGLMAVETLVKTEV
jgi:hypothetical protein